MKKKILVLALCVMTLIAPVYAQNETAGNTTSGNGSTAGGSTTNGNNTTTGNNGENSKTTTEDNSKTAAEKAAEARTLRVQIKTNLKTLSQLRTQLRTQLKEKQQLMLQYKEKEELTEQDKTEIKAMIKSLNQVQSKLGEAYGNAAKALKQYKGDNSDNKITGLNGVITSQQERIKLLQDCINELK